MSQSELWHWLAGAFDAAGGHSWRWVEAKPGAPYLRLFLSHQDPLVLQRVRAIAGCGSITRRSGDSPHRGYEWRVEGSRARELTARLNPLLVCPIPVSPPGDQEAWQPPDDDALLPTHAARYLGVQPATLRDYTRRGLLTPIAVAPGRYRYPRAALDALAAAPPRRGRPRRPTAGQA